MSTFVDPRPGDDQDALSPSEAVPEVVPVLHLAGYEILSELGRGGMGVVYKARHLGLKRVVALKMILAGLHAGDEDVRRFLAEAEVVAGLQHPHIVPLFESGTYEGRPYFTLAFVPGGSLADRLRAGPLAPQEAARIVEQAARGVEHAHRAGIVHRDLKPANVLIDEDGAVRITDFGLARRVEGGTSRTATGAVLGTPSYMAPEQAQGKKAIGPAADVYALGAVLYECLTGRPPFVAAAPLDTLLQVIGDEPVPPTRLVPRLPRDLQTICLKCLHKQPNRRYPSAAALADDLGRWRAGEPIVARPASAIERGLKWARRRPALAGLLVVSLAALVGLTVLASLLDVQRRRAEVRGQWAQEENKRAGAAGHLAEQRAAEAWLATERNRRALAVYQLARANVLVEYGQLQLARVALEHVPEDLRGWEWGWQQRHLEGSLYTLQAASAVAYHPRGGHFAVVRGLEVHVHDARNGDVVRRWKVSESNVRALVYSPDGRTLATAATEAGKPGEVAIWDSNTGALVRRFGPLKLAALAVAFSPDGRLLVSGGGELKLWDVATGREVRDFGDVPQIDSVSFSPDGRALLTGSEQMRPPETHLWDVASGERRWTTKRDIWGDFTGVFSPDGRRLVTGSTHGTLTLWTHRGDHLLDLKGRTQAIGALAFSPDGARLASGGDHGELIIWDMTGQRLAYLRGHRGSVQGLAWSPDCRRLVTAAPDGVKVWDPSGSPPALDLGPSNGSELTFCPDGRFLAWSPRPNTVGVWDIAAGRWLHELSLGDPGGTDHVTGIAYGPGQRLAGLTAKGGALWDLRSGQLVSRLPSEVRRLSFSPDGQLLAAAGDGVRLWHADTGQEAGRVGGSRSVRDVAFSPDGQRLALVSDSDSRVEVWRVDGSKPEVLLSYPPHRTYIVAFSPDGHWLATGHSDSVIHLWKAPDYSLAGELQGHSGQLKRVAFTANSRRLLSAGAEVIVWDVETGQAIFRLPAGDGLAVSPDGRRVATASSRVLLWEAAGAEGEAERRWRELAMDTPRSWHWDQAAEASKRGDWFAFLHHQGRLLGGWPASTSHLLEDRADALWRMGRKDEAVAHYLWMLQADPKTLDRRRDTSPHPAAEAAGRADRWDEAAFEFGRAVRRQNYRGDYRPEAWRGLLLAELKRGHVQDYRDACRRMLASQQPAAPEAQNSYAWFCVLAPNDRDILEKALTLVDQALRSQRSAGWLHTRALALYRLDRPEEALRTLEEAMRLKKAGSEPIYLIPLAMIQGRLGREAEGRRTLEQARTLLREQSETSWEMSAENALLLAEAELLLRPVMPRAADSP